MRIAMWSGPRNLSTAMMYAFAARDDCAVVDEPFYATYLAKTGLDHPMRAEILASQSGDPNVVIEQLTGSIPPQKPHFYQKHMAHHMLPGIDRSWIADVKNVFLIRHPARVIASYAAKREAPTFDDLGFWQQAEMFAQCDNPIVIDSTDIRADPRRAMSRLCNALGLTFDLAMLSWPRGGNVNDGVWATHWYGAAHRSTGFAGAEGPLPELEQAHVDLSELAMPYYQTLCQAKI